MRRRRFALGLAALVVGCARERGATTATPKRIVSQVVDADEILWELGQDVRRRVVGVSSMADDPRYTTSPGRWPKDVPRIAGKSEGLFAAKPDLVIVAEFSSPEVRALLETSGVRTLVLAGFDGFADYRARVAAIGGAVQAQGPAGALVERFDARLAELTVDRVGARPRAVSWVSGNVAGAGTTFDDIARAAGLENLAAAHDVSGHQQVPLEQVVAWDPEVVVTQCGVDDCERRRDEFAGAPGWSATRAGRNGGIVAVPSRHLFAAGWGMLDALAWIAKHTSPA